ncbi:Os02g0697800, partial [Oryza sativa Japonica Group]
PLLQWRRWWSTSWWWWRRWWWRWRRQVSVLVRVRRPRRRQQGRCHCRHPPRQHERFEGQGEGAVAMGGRSQETRGGYQEKGGSSQECRGAHGGEELATILPNYPPRHCQRDTCQCTEVAVPCICKLAWDCTLSLLEFYCCHCLLDQRRRFQALFPGYYLRYAWNASVILDVV